MNKKLTSAQIVSAVTGEPAAEIQKSLPEEIKTFKLFINFMTSLVKIAKDSSQFESMLMTYIVVMLEPFPLKTRLKILATVMEIFINKVDVKLSESIEKLRK